MTVRVCMMQRLEKGLTRLREDQVAGLYDYIVLVQRELMEIYAHCTVPCLYVIVNRRVTKEAFGWAKERGNCSIVWYYTLI